MIEKVIVGSIVILLDAFGLWFQVCESSRMFLIARYVWNSFLQGKGGGGFLVILLISIFFGNQLAWNSCLYSNRSFNSIILVADTCTAQYLILFIDILLVKSLRALVA